MEAALRRRLVGGRAPPPAAPPELTSLRSGAGLRDLESALDEEQRAVVFAPPGRTLVIAGAGSGKTRALTFRVARLLAAGVPPDGILLATFTNRAAREMLGRVEELSGVDGRAMWAGTFHHVANRVLRTYGGRIGLDPRYGLLDRDDARELLARCADDEGGRRVRGMPAPGLLQGVLSLATATSLPLDGALALHSPRFRDAAKAIGRIADRFQRRKAEMGLCDFDDLLVLWKLLLVECDDVRRELAERFRHVLVDEFQDASRLQVELMERSAEAGDLMAVGDDAQSIYRFRGAELDLLLDFPRRHPGARLLKLQSNYRSTPEIVALANRSIAHNRRRHEKVLRATRAAGELPSLVVLADARQQAEFVAARVEELVQGGRHLGELAVLYRSHAHSLELQVELTRRRVPYRVRSGPRFFEQAHIKDATAFLRVVANPRDELAWSRVLRLFPGIGPAAASTILLAIARDGLAALADPALVRTLPRGARPPLGRLCRLLDSLDGPGPGDLLRQVIAGHYREHAASVFDNANARLDDLAQLALYADRYPTTERLLTDLALVASVRADHGGDLPVPPHPPKPGEPPSEAVLPDGDAAPGERLTLTTIHQAKGLEWSVVFLLQLSDGHFPPAVTRHGSPEEEEERRLFHVAVTRARDLLHLCQPEFAEHAGTRTRLLPSRFLAELAAAPPYQRWQVTR
ncbi:MAG: ATP-dependent helicase [Myxococcales bacterium]|nr:ATP-dependent helicase [Myxococcales bacterium]